MKVTRNQLAAAVALAAAAPLTFAADGDLDFSGMVAAISAAAVVAAFMSMGTVKLGPNFAKWAINKVAGFFGR